MYFGKQALKNVLDTHFVKNKNLILSTYGRAP